MATSRRTLVKALGMLAGASLVGVLYVYGFPEQLCFMHHHNLLGRVPEIAQS